MPTEPPVLETSNFSIVLENGLTVVQSPGFTLPGPGTYTLEGPNGSGKSLIIRLLTGTLPGSMNSKRPPEIKIKGKEVSPIGDYKGALKAGIVAVFQSVNLINSMTVFENFLLAHSKTYPRQIAHYLWAVTYNKLASPPKTLARLLGSAVSPSLQRFIKRLDPGEVDWYNRGAIHDMAKDLFEKHRIDLDKILTSMASRLSGGELAAAKIVSAQMYKGTKVLLLDEAFSGVERNIWPRMIDSIRDWAYDKGAAVLAISHNTEELARWEPKIRFEIQDGHLKAIETLAFGFHRRALAARQLSIPAYEIETNDEDENPQNQAYSSLWARFGAIKQIVLVFDNCHANVSVVQEIVKFRPAGVTVAEMPISKDELGESYTHFVGLFRRIEESIGTQRTVIVLVGAAYLRTVGSFASLWGTHWECAGVVLVPTSFPDSIDAVFANTVRMTWGDVDPSQKNARFSAFFAPDAYILHLNISEPIDKFKEGLIKCFRLGLLFDKELLDTSKEALRSQSLSVTDANKIFRRAVLVINELCNLDSRGNGLMRVLRFGDLYAQRIHDITQDITESKIPSGPTLLIGMILESIVAGADEKIVHILAEVLRQWPLTIPDQMNSNHESDFIRAMETVDGITGIGDARKISNLKLESIAQFSIADLRDELARSKTDINRDLATFGRDKAEGAKVGIALANLVPALAQLRLKCARH